MKKYCFIFLVFIYLASCDDISRSEIEGKWQLKTVEKAGMEITVDTVWYNFQSKSIFQYQFFISQQDTFMLLPGVVKSNQVNILHLELITNEHLDQTDWHGINRSFTIEKLDKKNLILVGEEGYSYSFIRF